MRASRDGFRKSTTCRSSARRPRRASASRRSSHWRRMSRCSGCAGMGPANVSDHVIQAMEAAGVAIVFVDLSHRPAGQHAGEYRDPRPRPGPREAGRGLRRVLSGAVGEGREGPFRLQRRPADGAAGGAGRPARGMLLRHGRRHDGALRRLCRRAQHRRRRRAGRCRRPEPGIRAVDPAGLLYRHSDRVGRRRGKKRRNASSWART